MNRSVSAHCPYPILVSARNANIFCGTPFLLPQVSVPHPLFSLVPLPIGFESFLTSSPTTKPQTKCKEQRSSVSVRRNNVHKRRKRPAQSKPVWARWDRKTMAKKCLVIKQKKKPKFAVRAYTRCSMCGRPKGYVRYFGICRICLRESAHKGLLPGVTKSSW